MKKWEELAECCIQQAVIHIFRENSWFVVHNHFRFWVITRVSEYKSNDISKEIYYSGPFLAVKMAEAMHTTYFLEF